MRRMPDAIVLCGGAGLRLRSVIGRSPKAMASISGRPFLAVLLSQLRRHGFRRAILAVGYRGDVIRSHFGKSAQGICLTYSAETSPLGTGGAVLNAAAMVDSDYALVMNGDSYTDVDLGDVVADCCSANADMSVVVVRGNERRDCGAVEVSPDGRVTQFAEKQRLASRYYNAGIYMVSRRLLSSIQAGIEISLEKELFPRWLREGNYIKAFVHCGSCVDIGTPERYLLAQEILKNTEADVSQWRVP
jgi:mannose-1-phosphate guanylyltransferase